MFGPGLGTVGVGGPGRRGGVEVVGTKGGLRPRGSCVRTEGEGRRVGVGVLARSLVGGILDPRQYFTFVSRSFSLRFSH